jgi:hypothetical protein
MTEHYLNDLDARAKSPGGCVSGEEICELVAEVRSLRAFRREVRGAEIVIAERDQLRAEVERLKQMIHSEDHE